MIRFKITIIQPIEINIQTLIKFFDTKINIENFKKYENIKAPYWKQTMDELFNLYSSFIILDSRLINSEVLKEELKNNHFNINDKFNISDFLDSSDLKTYLMFDYRLFQFCIVYELGFVLPLNNIEDVTRNEKDKLDFYNCIRNIFVKETDNSYLPSIILNLQNNLIMEAKKFIAVNFNLKDSMDSLKILNNSGNITNVAILENLNDKEFEKYSNCLLNLNSLAERNQTYSSPIKIKTVNSKYDNLYFFNGRFHTIILQNQKDEYRYIPIQFQMQYLWFYLSKQINLILEFYNDNILKDSSISKISEYSDKIDAIINKIENLNIFNHKFKLSIEADSKIYHAIEEKWNIENMIKTSNEYVVYFKDYLARIYTKKSSKMEQRQNKILLFITLFQFIALLSVWNDYLNLLSVEFLQKAKGILSLFGSESNLETFNIYLPIIFFIIILCMFFYIFKNKE
ncbi:hypothetical protein CVT06_08595 [Campylobacter concisus]|uniref:Uncharacterized protein n=1 Tax=Campylobacter concisus TaxID=199 RepID=A0A7S9R7E4_9BACT|nr:hypothetical protein [Campylobacter concisus]QPH85139.1 hypothetical protein CVT06_08595 [Campylobacter concisus]